MKTAQEAAYGELAIDKIKKLFAEDLTEWEQEDLAKWAAHKLGYMLIGEKCVDNQDLEERMFPSLPEVMNYYTEYEILDEIPISVISRYLGENE